MTVGDTSPGFESAARKARWPVSGEECGGMRGTRSRRSPISRSGSSARCRLVRRTVMRICCVCAAFDVRLPPQTLPFATDRGANRLLGSPVGRRDGGIVHEAEERDHSRLRWVANRRTAGTVLGWSSTALSRVCSRPRATARPCSDTSPARWRSRSRSACWKTSCTWYVRAGMIGLQVPRASEQMLHAALMRGLLELAIGAPTRLARGRRQSRPRVSAAAAAKPRLG